MLILQHSYSVVMCKIAWAPFVYSINKILQFNTCFCDSSSHMGPKWFPSGTYVGMKTFFSIGTVLSSYMNTNSVKWITKWNIIVLYAASDFEYILGVKLRIRRLTTYFLLLPYHYVHWDVFFSSVFTLISSTLLSPLIYMNSECLQTWGRTGKLDPLALLL